MNTEQLLTFVNEYHHFPIELLDEAMNHDNGDNAADQIKELLTSGKLRHVAITDDKVRDNFVLTDTRRVYGMDLHLTLDIETWLMLHELFMERGYIAQAQLIDRCLAEREDEMAKPKPPTLFDTMPYRSQTWTEKTLPSS